MEGDFFNKKCESNKKNQVHFQLLELKNFIYWIF
jgi:hypothetical protein